MSRNLGEAKTQNRKEKEGIKRAKIAMSVAALTISVGGWLSLHASEPPAANATPPGSIATSRARDGGHPAPVTSTRSSR